jgi:hypothetical protein
LLAEATSASSGGFYVRAEGSYQSLDLPTVDLGQGRLILLGPRGILANNANGGPIATFKPTVTGYGTEGAFGYVLRDGTLSPVWGSHVRLEAGGSYVNADQSQSQSTILFPDTLSFQHVNGAQNFILICNNDPCLTTTTLRSHYEAWQADIKAASDFPAGPLTVTPSLAIFGGEGRNDQTLAQATSFVGRALQLTLDETASEKGSDLFGTRVGLKGKLDVTPWLAVGLGGDFGFAARHISLVAYDNSLASRPARFATTNDVTAFLAGAEASLIAKPLSNVAIKLFGGVTYDDHVPGIAAQNYPGAFFSNPQGGTPVSIRSSAEMGYYAGLGVVVHFGL